MERAITQTQARLMICDYMRESGRKTIGQLVPDISRQTKRIMFGQRTLEMWMNDPDHNLKGKNWEIMLEFFQSKLFKHFVPYANEDHTESRLIRVGDGLTALYLEREKSKIEFSLTEQGEQTGQEAIKLLQGIWTNALPNATSSKDFCFVDKLCCVEPVPGKRYAKFLYLSDLTEPKINKISARGFAIYLGSKKEKFYDYYHTFILHLWYRKDPTTGSTSWGHLTCKIKAADNQPIFTMGNIKPRDIFAPDIGVMWADSFSIKFEWWPYPLPPKEDLLALSEDILPYGLA